MKGFLSGDFVPGFVAESSVNPRFVFETVAGRRVLLAFLGSGHSALGAALMDALLAAREMLRRHRVLLYLVTTDRRDRGSARFSGFEDPVVFWDEDMAIHRAYGMVVDDVAPGPNGPGLRVGMFLLRENLRVWTTIHASPVETVAARLDDACRGLPEFEPDAHAPVLVMPDVFDRDLCRALIDVYEATGGYVSGFMRDVDGVTRKHEDPKTKRRRDASIDDPRLRGRIIHRLTTRLVPEIKKAFDFDATRIERFIVACYDAADAGFFRAHRDNRNRATEHRRFAVTINLNTEDYEGGELSFPEYGPRRYRAPTGTATVFSCALLHEARPVTRGRRFAFLPFLYDDAAAQLRAETAQYLDQETVRIQS